MSALRPIFYFAGLSVCGEKNQMALPSFASTLEVLYRAGYGLTYRTAEILRLE